MLVPVRSAVQRAELTKELIKRHEFTVVLAESDFPDAFR